MLSWFTIEGIALFIVRLAGFGGSKYSSSFRSKGLQHRKRMSFFLPQEIIDSS